MIATATKVCSRCGETKPVTAFYARYSWCRECFRAYNREWRRRNPGSKKPFLECGRCRRQLDPRGVRGQTRATGVCARCRRSNGRPRFRLDHQAIQARLRTGALYRDIAGEFGCAMATVKAVAARYGLQRTGKRPPRVPKNRQLRAVEGGLLTMESAVAAYLRCVQHHADNEGRERTPYTGPVAWDFLAAAAPNSSDRHAPDYKRWRQMVDQIIEAAKEAA